MDLSSELNGLFAWVEQLPTFKKQIFRFMQTDFKS